MFFFYPAVALAVSTYFTRSHLSLRVREAVWQFDGWRGLLTLGRKGGELPFPLDVPHILKWRGLHVSFLSSQSSLNFFSQELYSFGVKGLSVCQGYRSTLDVGGHLFQIKTFNGSSWCPHFPHSCSLSCLFTRRTSCSHLGSNFSPWILDWGSFHSILIYRCFSIHFPKAFVISHFPFLLQLQIFIISNCQSLSFTFFL